jgi:hypothetical protein
MRRPTHSAAPSATRPGSSNCLPTGSHAIQVTSATRPPNSSGFYAFAILLGVFGILAGLALLGFAILSLGDNIFPARAVAGGVIIPIVSGSVIAWAFAQMRLPVAHNAPPFRWVRFIVFSLVILFVGALAVGGCLFGFAYFLHEML